MIKLVWVGYVKKIHEHIYQVHYTTHCRPLGMFACWAVMEAIALCIHFSLGAPLKGLMSLSYPSRLIHSLHSIFLFIASYLLATTTNPPSCLCVTDTTSSSFRYWIQSYSFIILKLNNPKYISMLDYST